MKRRIIAWLTAPAVALGIMVGVSAPASAAPGDVTVTNTVSCGMGPGVQTIVNNTATDLNIVNETVQYPSGHFNFPDPVVLTAGGQGGGGWEFASNQGDIAYEWIVKNADTGEVYYDQWFAFDCNTVKANPSGQTCGTSGTFGGINGYATPKSVYYVTQGNGPGSIATQSAPISLTQAFQDVPWSFTPQSGDTTFSLSVRDASDDSELTSATLSVMCTSAYVTSVFCDQYVPIIGANIDATLDPSGHTYELKINGTTVYGPANIPAGEYVSEPINPTGLVPGSTYTAEQYLDGVLYETADSGPTSGTVPNCTAPVYTVLPKLSGKAAVGSKLTVTAAATSASLPVELYYIWRVNGVAVHVGSSLVLTSAMYGKNVRCDVELYDANYQQAVIKSTATVKVGLGVAPVAKVKPTIVGKAKVGYTLKVKSVGVWSPKPTSYKYQWYRKVGTKLVLIKGAIKSSYKLVKADRKHRVILLVTAVKAYYNKGKAFSAYTAIVK